VIVPEALLSLLRQLAREQILSRYAKRISKLPFATHAPSEYLQRFSYQDHTLLVSYVEKHLKEREQADDEIQEAEAVLDRLLTEGARVGVTENWRHIYPPQLHPYAHYINADFTRNFTKAAELLRGDTALVTRRVATAAEHLRDLLAAQVANSNLKLQRTLFWIAVLALFVSVGALLVGVATEDAKRAIWEHLGTLRFRPTSQ
jgi:hypothetical protein